MTSNKKIKNVKCNGYIPKNKVSKQTHEESANDSSNNAVNDATNVLPSCQEKDLDVVVNTSNGTITKTKKRTNADTNYGFRYSAAIIERQRNSKRMENHESLLKKLKRSTCGTSFIKEAEILARSTNSKSIMQIPIKSIKDYVLEAENLARSTNSESIMLIPTKPSRTMFLKRLTQILT